MKTVVLNVDDSFDDVLLVKQACAAARVRFALQFVDDGERAIEYLSGRGEFADRAKHPLPTLVLLDLNMPRKTGFEVLEWIKQDAQLRRIPVAIFTSSANDKDINSSLSRGADFYLSKPMSYRGLVNLMRALDAGLNDPVLAPSTALRSVPEYCGP